MPGHEVKDFRAYGQVKPTRVKIWDMTISCNDNEVEAKTIKDFLEDGRDSRSLITMVDRFGTSHYVRIQTGYPRIEEVVDEQGRYPELGVHLRVEKVDWS